MRSSVFKAFLLALLVMLLGQPAAQAAFPGANGKIAFDNGFVPNIWTINPDGSGLALLTQQPDPLRGDVQPHWSPDGSKIAFTVACNDEESCGAGGEVWVMNADGSNQTNLTGRFDLWNYAGSWSPDGSKILFVRRGGTTPGIYVMNADGSGMTRIRDEATDITNPTWSPDGQKIAFVGCQPQPAGCSIFLMNPDGSGVVQITSGGSDPTWSPDGQRLAFTDSVAFSGGSNLEIFTINADGTNERNITNDPPNHDEFPAWSPDGRKIAWQKFVGGSSDPFQLSVMNADGSGGTVIQTGRPVDRDLDWQPLPTATYEHPQSASSLSASLVPTFRPCGTGANPTNGQHSPPLSTRSCLPPVPGSNIARVGLTSTDSASFTVVPGDSDATNGDQADVTLSASLSDVKTPAGADYVPNASGPDLTEITRLRLTDKANNYGGASGTATEYDFRVPLDCAATADPSIGSTCSTATSADSLLPGFVTEQRQTVVQAFRVRVDDAGANGTTGDSDDRIFATQGIYVP